MRNNAVPFRSVLKKKSTVLLKKQVWFFANSIERVAQYSVMYVLMEKLNAQIYSISVHTISREKLHNTVGLCCQSKPVLRLLLLLFRKAII